MFREATEDTILEIPNLGGEGFKPMAVPKGMTVIIYLPWLASFIILTYLFI